MEIRQQRVSGGRGERNKRNTMGKGPEERKLSLLNNPKLCNQYYITYCEETEALGGKKNTNYLLIILLCAEHCTRHLACIISLNPHGNLVSCIIMLTSQMNKLRLSETK